MTISQLESSFSSLLVLVTVDAALNCGISTVPVEQSVWQCCLKEKGKNSIFVPVQGLPLKACFFSGFASWKLSGSLVIMPRETGKLQKTNSYFYCSYWRGQICILAQSEKIDMSDTNRMAFFFLCLAQSGRTGHIYVLILSGNCFWFCFCLLGG